MQGSRGEERRGVRGAAGRKWGRGCGRKGGWTEGAGIRDREGRNEGGEGKGEGWKEGAYLIIPNSHRPLIPSANLPYPPPGRISHSVPIPNPENPIPNSNPTSSSPLIRQIYPSSTSCESSSSRGSPSSALVGWVGFGEGGTHSADPTSSSMCPRCRRRRGG